MHHIVAGDEKWIYYDNPKRRKSWGKPGHASTSPAKLNIHGSKLLLCIWWNQQGLAYYELLKRNEIITRSLSTTTDAFELSIEGKTPAIWAETRQTDFATLQRSVICCKTGETYLETLKWEVLPHPSYLHTRHFPFRLLLVPIDDTWPGWTALPFLWRCQKMDRPLDNLKKLSFFQSGIYMLPEKWQKLMASDGQYFQSLVFY